MIAILLALALAQCGGSSGRYEDERWTRIPNTSASRAKVQICIDNKRCGHRRVRDLRRSVDKSELLVGFKKGRTIRPPSLPAGTEIMRYRRTLEVMATAEWSTPGP